MAACISRGPKTTSNQHTVVATHTNGSTQQQQYNQIIKIYTEWGNHYLEKARFKKLIQNLQSDLTDGVLLADVVEAVCGQKVADINRKPKTPMNMVENIVNCLTLLERIGVALDGITAKDVREGNLKTTLGLFFALSKYKQQQKQRQATQSIVLTPERQQQKRQHLAPPSEDMKQSKLPSPHYNLQSAALAGAGTSIPTPISQRQSRALAPGLNSLKCSSSNNSSRSASPSHSFIPTPKSGLNARSSLNEKQLASIRSANKIPAANCSYNTPPVSSVKNPMIDKAKGPNVKEKNKSIVGFTSSSINSAKRTSSSSGVSSTRSERSDSSNSTCNDVRPTFSDQKDNNVAFTVNEVKPMLRKKVVVKPTENRAVKFPSKANNPLRIEEKPNTQDTSNTKEDSKATMNESSRLSGSGIPKPTAAVKGTAKPTNSVAPMIVKPETDEKPSTNGIEEITEKKEGIEKPKPESGNHSKQSSIGEEEDTLLNIKPMEPMLRGYKRGIVLPHRVVPVNGYMDNQQRHMNGYQSQQYHYMSRFDIKKGAENEDYEVTSGYVSDGDVLQSNGSMNGKLYSDVDGGYMSEGGAQFYERYSNNLEMKLKALKKSEASKANNLSSISGSQNNKQPVNDRVHSTDVLTALSTGSPLHKFGNKLNGRGPGPDEGPISPPEPTPTHAGSYSTSYRASPPHMSPPEPTPVVYRVIGARSHIKKSDNSQQTDNTSFSRQSLNNSSGQWKKYTEAELNSTNGRNSAVVNPQCSDNIRIRDKRSPSAGPTVSNTNSLLRNKMDKRRTSSTSSGTGSREELAEMEYYNGERKSRVDGKNKVRGVPSSFGYVKRSTNTNGKESRTAQVSAVPRTKVKVSGGTQTDMKSYSLSSTAANQLSQCVRERIMMGQDTMQKSPARSQNAHKPADRDSLPGSLSDSTYTDLQIMSNQHNSWFRHGSPYTASLPARTSANAGLIDADSIESLPAQLHHRASLTNTRFLSGTSPSTSNVPARLSRSNSIRSTKSEKLYPSMLQRSEELEPLYSIPYGLSGGPSHMHNCSSQDEPPSPTPSHLSQGTSVGNSSRYHYAASPSSSNHSFNRNSPYMNFLTKMNSKEDDMHGSAMSLVSTASSSLYSTPEDKQAQEMRRLKKDLSEAQQKVHSLTSQLSTNSTIALYAFVCHIDSIKSFKLAGRGVDSKNTMKKLKRDIGTKAPTGSKTTVLPAPDKSPSDKKSYKVVRLQNNLTALLVSDGPELYHIEDFYNISDSSSSSGASQSGTSSGEEYDDDDPAYESCKTLENVKNDKFAACALSINVGSFSDPNVIPGLAHFLEHMVFMGSKKYPKENQFDVFIQKHGGSTNAVTSCECTTFYFDCNVRHLFKALDMFSQFFISPLLKKESMVREREAVDSEFELATSSDSARIEQIIGTFASDENPVGKFMWGNSKTLKDRVSEDQLYESLRQFHQQYYSANLMTVAILAKLPIDTLENCALECFTSVPDRQVTRPTFDITKPLFIHEKFHRIYYVTSVKNVTKVVLMWEMPPVEKLYHSKPDEMISWLVAHEGRGSLLSYLKSKLWALGLWGGITNDSVYCNSLYSLFRIEIALSEDGFAHLNDVITATFSYLKLVRASLPQRRLYDEVKTLSDLDFKFQEELTTTEFVENIVEDMHYYPSKDFLTGPHLYFKYNPDEVTKLLNYITADKVNIIVRAKEFKDTIAIDQVEPWFQTKYGSAPIPADMLAQWQSIEPYSEFKLPSNNPFISSDFHITAPTANESKYPTRIRNNQLFEVWYKLDTVFKLPIASINLHFLSPAGIMTGKSLVMLDLFVGMISYILMEDTYPANLAQLYYAIEVSPRGGVLVKVKGFNHKLPKLLATIIDCMKNFAKEFNVNMFNTLKTELKKTYRNTLLKRNNLVQELRFTIIEEPYFNTSEKYNVVSHIHEKEFLAFIESFFTNSFTQCLVQGNISRDNAITVCHNSVRVFNPRQVAKKDLPYIRIRRIPVGQKCVFMRSFNELDSNSVTVNYFQWGNANMMQYVKLELLVKLMEEKVFNVLRTQEQLGYEVYCTFRNNFGIIGFTITVHSSSSKFETHYVEERISRFLDDFTQSLNNYRSDEFYKEREALIKTKSIVYDNLKQEVDYNLHEIIMEEYVFDRRWKEIDWLHKVSLSDIKAMLTSITKKGSDRNRRLTIQVLGNKAEMETPKEALMDEQKFDIQLMDGEENLKNYYIKEIKTFKSSLFLYPKSKIMNGKVPSIR